MGHNNVIRDKSKKFAIRIVRFANYLREEKKESVLSKQILRCGTSIGANVCESRNAQSRDDFAHKLSIALKEADETAYWLDVLVGADVIDRNEYDSLYKDLNELISLLVAIIKSIKLSNGSDKKNNSQFSTLNSQFE